MRRTSDKTVRLLLDEEYQKRLQKNSRYSLRAFARDLKISPSRLIEVFNCQAGISRQRAKTIAEMIYTDSKKIDYFVNVAEVEFGRSKSVRQKALLKLKKTKQLKTYYQPYADKAKFFSNWRNLALFELAKLDGFDGTLKWLVEKSAFSEDFVKTSLLQMREFGIAKFADFDDKLELQNNNFFGEFQPDTKHVVQFNSDVLDEARHKLLTNDKSYQFFTSILIPVDIENIKELRQKALDFTESVGVSQDAEKRKNNLYCLNVQFFPILL